MLESLSPKSSQPQQKLPLQPKSKKKIDINSHLYQAAAAAQRLAFAPVSFMTAYCLKRMGVLDALFEALSEGLSEAELAEKASISLYAANLLLESGLAIDALKQDAGRYHLTKLGHVLRSDPMTEANFEFIYQVCYKGLFHLEDSLRNGSPSGLPTISAAKTVYEGLHSLSPKVKKAWLDFDHFYSDSAFTEALPHIFSRNVTKLLDIGGNTGRFAKSCLAYNRQVQVTICDLPQQIMMANSFLQAEVGSGRLCFHGCDLLEPSSQLPRGFDVIWMSQFLVCFDEDTVLRILTGARAALEPQGRLLILDTFWDRQADPATAFCLIQTSPYFTTIANGNSKIYRSQTIIELAQRAGLQLQNIVDELGISHSLMIFTRN